MLRCAGRDAARTLRREEAGLEDAKEALGLGAPAADEALLRGAGAGKERCYVTQTRESLGRPHQRQEEGRAPRGLRPPHLPLQSSMFPIP